jgi:hypothetical protein
VAGHVGSVAVLWRGDPGVVATGTREYGRLLPVFRALSEAGAAVEPVVYDDGRCQQVLEQLARVDGVLVWVDPIGPGADRAVLNDVLRDVSGRGVWVSAHPDTIEKMGTKEVLFHTRSLGWGVDTQLYVSASDLRQRFCLGLASGQARVIKQSRGNGGIGVWKVAVRDVGMELSIPSPDTVVRVQHAAPRDDVTEDVTVGEFMTRCEQYLVGDGKLIDQPFMSHLDRGMVRAYLVQEQVVGFARQHPAPTAQNVLGLPSAKTMFDADHADLAELRRRLEVDWVPGLRRLVDLEANAVPFLWDADFLYGSPTETGTDTYVLCEINVSSVLPFPGAAPDALAAAVRNRLTASR